MFKFSLLRQLFGLLLILLAWVDPLSFGTDFQVVCFILGFDIMSWIPKIIIFCIDFFWDISGFGLFLLLQVVDDIIFEFLPLGKLLEILVKSGVVFLIIFANGFSFWLALIVAIIDALLIIQRKLF